MPRIVAIADTHKRWNELVLPKGDILIHAGDFDCSINTLDLYHFNVWLGKQRKNFREIICVAGNHDGQCDNYSAEQCQKVLHNAIYLENSGLIFNNKSIWGSPVTPAFGYWFFMSDRGENIKKYWDRIPENTEILITHGPPYGILDETPDYLNGTREHVGCSELLARIKQLPKLKLHIFGHLHREFGDNRAVQKDGILYINASVMNNDYDIVHEPMVIDF